MVRSCGSEVRFVAVVQVMITIEPGTSLAMNLSRTTLTSTWVRTPEHRSRAAC